MISHGLGLPLAVFGTLIIPAHSLVRIRKFELVTDWLTLTPPSNRTVVRYVHPDGINSCMVYGIRIYWLDQPPDKYEEITDLETVSEFCHFLGEDLKLQEEVARAAALQDFEGREQ